MYYNSKKSSYSYSAAANDVPDARTLTEETNSERTLNGGDRSNDNNVLKTQSNGKTTETIESEESPTAFVQRTKCRQNVADTIPAITTVSWAAERERSTGNDNRRSEDDQKKTNNRYSYAGPPKINLSTWNERPKRQVSIKTDRDYVIGIRQRFQQQRTPDVVTNENDNGKPQPAVSRVPIVKSVELKKPYAEQLQLQTTAVSPTLALSEAIKAQAKLSNGYGLYHSGGPNVIRQQQVTTADNELVKSSSSSSFTFGKSVAASRPLNRKLREISANVDPRESLLESIRSFGGRDNLRKIRA